MNITRGEQISLFDEGAAHGRPTIDPLFFALQLDAVAASAAIGQAERLRRQYGLKGRPQSPELLHVTLHFLGYSPDDPGEIVERSRRALTDFRAPAIDACFDRVVSFRRKSNRPLVLVGGDAPALLIFQKRLRSALLLAHLPAPEKAGFTPHVTLLRDDGEVPEQSVAPVCWKAHEFVLLRSHHGHGRHEVLARFPLYD